MERGAGRVAEIGDFYLEIYGWQGPDGWRFVTTFT